MNIYARRSKVILGLLSKQEQSKGMTYKEIVEKLSSTCSYILFNLQEYLDLGVYTGRLGFDDNVYYITDSGRKSLAFLNKETL